MRDLSARKFPKFSVREFFALRNANASVPVREGFDGIDEKAKAQRGDRQAAVGRAHRRAVDVFAQVHQRQESAENTGFKVIGEGQAAGCDAAKVSPFSVMKRMISRWRSCGVLPSAVSRRMAAQPASSDKVKCKTQTPCSASAGGVSFLHPAVWQRVPIWDADRALNRKHHSNTKIQCMSGHCCESCISWPGRRFALTQPAYSLYKNAEGVYN